MQAKHQRPSFKNSSRNPEKMKKTRKATCPTFPPRNMNYTTISAFNQTESHSPSSSARTFTSSATSNAHHRHPSVLQPVWSMNSLMEVLPESPSPIYSHGSKSLANQTRSTKSETYYSDIATEFSTPRKQSFGTTSNDNNCSNCFFEIDEWLEHATKFCPSNYYTTENGDLRQNGSQEDKMSMSSICKTFLTVPDHELYNITLPSVREESPGNDGQRRFACMNSIYGSSKCGSTRNERRKLITRPKPYNAFLNEIEREKMDAQREALKKAQQKKMMDRMRRKEAAIDDWELQQTNNAMKDMMKLQNNLECKRIEASAKAHKKICLAKRKAEKRKANLRQSNEKISLVTNISDTHCCGDFMWLKPGPIC